MLRVVERENLRRALRQVKRNKGSPGIDGKTVEELPVYLKEYWPQIRERLLSGTYRPKAVRRVEIAKPGGGVRTLGIPTVLDRLIQQAIAQVLQSQWDEHFHDHSYGFRPNRSAHQAIRQSQSYVQSGYSWVVDCDLESFFDQVNHDVLMSRLKRRTKDGDVLRLINRYIKVGVREGNKTRRSTEGLPQGGPLSPILSNIVLNELDLELDRRGHRFVRYADDVQVYVKSRQAGERTMRNLQRFISEQLRLRVNTQKSAVDRAWKRTYLGFTLSARDKKLRVSERSLSKLKDKVRVLSRRTRGHSLDRVIAELRDSLLGWKAYFDVSEVLSPLREVDKWIRRRLRSYIWKQWGRRGYRRLRALGVERFLAWNTAKSAHGPWRLSASPALYKAMPNRYFKDLGLPELAAR